MDPRHPKVQHTRFKLECTEAECLLYGEQSTREAEDNESFVYKNITFTRPDFLSSKLDMNLTHSELFLSK
jgi:hypothetical protein